MKSSLFISFSLLLLLVLQAEAARHRRPGRSGASRKAAASAKGVERIPFQRLSEDSPQVIQILIGSPPQKVNVALVYNSVDASTDPALELFNSTTKFYSCDDGLERDKFYKSTESKSFEKLPINDEQQLYREQIALGANAASMQPFQFSFADFVYDINVPCKENIGGLLHVNAFRSKPVWSSVFASKPAPIVTFTADRTPKIGGAFQTGEMLIGGLDEEKCGREKKTFIEWANNAMFRTTNYTLNYDNRHSKFGHPKLSYVYVDLSSSRMTFDRKQFEAMMKEVSVEKDPQDGHYYVPCDIKWSVGYKAKYDGIAFEIPLSVDQTRKNARGQCLIRAKVDTDDQKIGADYLNDHCVHFEFKERNKSVKTNDSDEDDDPETTRMAFSKRV